GLDRQDAGPRRAAPLAHERGFVPARGRAAARRRTRRAVARGRLPAHARSLRVTSAAHEALPALLARPSKHKRLVLSLARAESRRLLRHPVLLVGLTLSVVRLATERDISPAHVGYHWYSGSVGGTYMDLAGSALLWLALATLVSSNLAALRSRRDRTEETYDSLPADAHARTAAQLLAVACPVAISAVLVTAAFFS